MNPSFWNGRRVLVAGGTGFLGSHLIERLSEVDCLATAVSRRTGHDLRDLATARRALAEVRPEFAINCAGHQGGNAYQLLKPGELYFDNIMMGANLMEAARLQGVLKYVNLVPACAYPGYVTEDVLREEELDAGRLHESVDHYGITKRAAYSQAKAYHKQYGFVGISLSLFNLYGPRDHFSPEQSHGLAALVRRFVEAKRSGAGEVVVWGTGRAVREWIYVADGVEGILRAAERYSEVELLNLCTGRGYSISELAESIKNVVGYKGKIVYDPQKPEGALVKVGSAEKMRRVLGWEPRVELTEGIRKTVEWFELNHEEAIRK